MAGLTAGPHATTVITSAAGSDTGLVRPGNEDSGYAGRRLFAVADGLGGHAAGEVASAIAITAIAPCDSAGPPEGLLPLLATAVRDANDAIRRRAEDDPATRGMGTTLTAMLWSGRAFALAHIGDSRAYRLRDGRLVQLTEDHSLGNLVANAPPALAPMISRYLDGRPDRSPDLSVREAAAGDKYLLCSDGLTAVVPDSAIRDLMASGESAERTVSQLTDLANRAGGPDNITVIIIEVGATPTLNETATAPSMLGAVATR
jgi:serine/threonine protein phosphatase PrpC